MADTIITSPEWQAIRSLAEQGVDYNKLAEEYGVTYGSIAMRSHREGWFTPDRVKMKLNRMNGGGVSDAVKNGEKPPISDKKAEILADNWSERSAYIRDLQYKTAIRAIERSKDIITIETASDLKAAVHVARQATGLLDAEAPAISLNLSGGGGFFEAAGPVYEAVSESVEPVTLEDCGV